MSVDIGDAVTVTFATVTGATVAVSWINPSGVTAVSQAVTESPAGSGSFPSTFVLNAAGVWEVRFTASGATTAVERYYVRAVALTGPPPLATVGEVREQFGQMTAAQETLTGTLLRAASRRVRSRFQMIDTQISSGVVDAEVAALGIVAMVLRVLRNPLGLKSESTGPFSRTYDTSVAAGLLVIGPDEAILFKPNPWRFPIAKTIVTRAGLANWPEGIHPEIRRQSSWGGSGYYPGEGGMAPGYDPIADVSPFGPYPMR